MKTANENNWLLESFCKRVATLKEYGVPEAEAKAVVKELMEQVCDIVIAEQKAAKKQEVLFVMMCKEFGAKFKFHAENPGDARIKAKKYCNYHSKPNQYYAVQYTEDIHPEYLGIRDEWVAL